MFYTSKSRATHRWFDKECCVAKRLARRLERAVAVASRLVPVSTIDTAFAKAVVAKAAWLNNRRCFRSHRQQKNAEFWLRMMEVDSCNPRRLWDTVDAILGYGKVPASAVIDVNLFSRYFDCQGVPCHI